MDLDSGRAVKAACSLAETLLKLGTMVEGANA